MTDSCGSASATLAGHAAGAVLVDLGQEQLAVDGEHHAASGDVHRVGDDALPAFAGAFAAGLLLLGDLLVVGVGQQPARIRRAAPRGGPVPSADQTLSHSAVTRSSGPSERRNNARVPSPIACAERGAPEVNRRVRALRRGNAAIACDAVSSGHMPQPTRRPAQRANTAGITLHLALLPHSTRAHGRILQVLRPIFEGGSRLCVG